MLVYRRSDTHDARRHSGHTRCVTQSMGQVVAELPIAINLTRSVDGSSEKFRHRMIRCMGGALGEKGEEW